MKAPAQLAGLLQFGNRTGVRRMPIPFSTSRCGRQLANPRELGLRPKRKTAPVFGIRYLQHNPSGLLPEFWSLSEFQIVPTAKQNYPSDSRIVMQTRKNFSRTAVIQGRRRAALPAIIPPGLEPKQTCRQYPASTSGTFISKLIRRYFGS